MADENASSGRERRSVLDMPMPEFRSLGHALIDQIADFYESLPRRAVTRPFVPEAFPLVCGADKLEEQGRDAGEVLAELVPALFRHSLHNGHPKFMGYVTSSAAPLGALADLLASAINANVAKWDLAPAASEMESLTVRWIADLISATRAIAPAS